MTDDTTQPNGILVALSDECLYVAQSDYDPDAPELRTYPIEDRSLGDYDVLHNFHPHRGVDGMCLTATGNVVACAGGRRVARPTGLRVHTVRSSAGKPLLPPRAD